MQITDEPYHPINYKIHLPVILFLLIIQFFIVDIYSFFYLRHAYEKCVSEYSPSSTYMKGEYSSISKQESPSDYKFVTIQKQNGHIYEIYYTLSGEKMVVEYTANGKWQSSSYDGGGINYFLFLPLCGFSLFMFATIKKAFRTGEIFSWRLSQHSNDKFERLCFIYGVPLFISWIIFGLLGRLG